MKDIYAELILNYFPENKYTSWYINIVTQLKLTRLNRNEAKLKYGIIETHHIIPTSIDNLLHKVSNNKVHCTPKEHFILHKILERMTYKTKYHKKMQKAITAFSMSKFRRVYSSKDYQLIREMHSLTMKGPNGKIGDKNSFYGKHHSEESKRIMSQHRKGKTWDELYSPEKVKQLKLNTSIRFKNKKIDIPYSKERRDKISEAAKKYIWITNGVTDIRHLKSIPILDGYFRGRSNGISKNRNLLGQFC